MAGIDISKYQSAPKSGVKKKEGNMMDFLKKDITLFGNELNDKKKEEFYLELNVLLAAGVDIKTTLELISTEQSKEKDKIFFNGINEKVIKGSTLSEALKNTGKFSAYEYFSIQIGEETGKVSEVLKDLSEFFQKRIKQKRQIMSVLSYPIFVLVASFGALAFMLNTVVPMFSGMYKRFGAELPWITSFIIKLSNAFSDYFYLFVLVSACTFFLLYSQRKKLWFRKASTSFVLKLPFIGEVIRKIYIARLCHSLTLLLSSKIPLLRAIELIKKMISFYPLEESLTQVEKDILGGVALNKSLSQFPFYYRKMVTLVKIGEEVNQLDQFFSKIASQYTDDVEHQIGILKSLIEPIMIVVLGIIVGTIVVAMYLPLFQLTSVF
jgi:type IV pilus assembly protein PilC